AAVGMAVGAGAYWLAALATGLIWFILVILHYAEMSFERMLETREYIVKYEHVQGQEYLAYDEFFKDKAYRLMASKMEKINSIIVTTWTVRASQKRHDEIVKKLVEDQRIIELDY